MSELKPIKLFLSEQANRRFNIIVHRTREATTFSRNDVNFLIETIKVLNNMVKDLKSNPDAELLDNYQSLLQDHKELEENYATLLDEVNGLKEIIEIDKQRKETVVNELIKTESNRKFWRERFKHALEENRELHNENKRLHEVIEEKNAAIPSLPPTIDDYKDLEHYIVAYVSWAFNQEISKHNK